MSLPMRKPVEFAPEIITTPAPAPLRRRAERRWRAARALTLSLFGLTILGLAGVGAQSLWRSSAPEAMIVMAPATNAGRVRLASSSVERRLGFVTLTGSVANRTDRPLRNVEAVVELLDRRNRPLRLERALVALDPVPARSDSPFRVEMADAKGAANVRVRFAQLSGPALH